VRLLNLQVTAGNNVTQSVEARAKLYSVNCTCKGMSFVFLHGACSKWEFLVSYYNQDGSFTWNNVHAARTVYRTVTAVIVERLHTRVPASPMSCGHSSTDRANGSFTVYCPCNIRPACSFVGGCGISSLFWRKNALSKLLRKTLQTCETLAVEI